MWQKDDTDSIPWCEGDPVWYVLGGLDVEQNW